MLDVISVLFLLPGLEELHGEVDAEELPALPGLGQGQVAPMQSSRGRCSRIMYDRHTCEKDQVSN